MRIIDILLFKFSNHILYTKDKTQSWYHERFQTFCGVYFTISYVKYINTIAQEIKSTGFSGSSK